MDAASAHDHTRVPRAVFVSPTDCASVLWPVGTRRFPRAVCVFAGQQPPPEKARERWQHAARRAAESKAKDIATAARLERARKQRLGRKSFFARDSVGDEEDDGGSVAALHHSHLSVDEVAGYFRRFEPWAEQRKLLLEYGIEVTTNSLQLDETDRGASDRVVLAAVSCHALRAPS